MNMVRTSLFNGIAVVVRMATGLVLNKILAYYVGPSGYAILGQFQNLLSMLLLFANGGVNTGVIKYTAEHFNDEVRQRTYWRTAGSITLVCSLIASFALLVFRVPLAGNLLGDSNLSGVLVWLAISLTLISLNAFLLAILNGKKEIKFYISANIVGSVTGLIISGLLVWKWGLYGALVALSVNQSVVFFVTLTFCKRTQWFQLSSLFGRIDKKAARNLGKFVVMAVTSALVVPTTQILVRNYIVVTFGLDYAGFWDASNKISSVYLSLITTTLSLYYLPRISEIDNMIILRREIWQGYLLIIPVVAIMASCIFVFRELVVATLFTPSFMPMVQLFQWQLVGDVIKIASWLLGFVLLGKAMMIAFVITEVGFSATLYFFTITITKIAGFEGVAMAYALNYSLYFIAMYLIVFGNYLGGRRNAHSEFFS